MTVENKPLYDVIIVGAGLSGLFCALTLKKQNLKVLIIEKSARAGGLCGSTFIDGYEFCTACYDFGSGMQRELKKLGIQDIEFIQTKTLFYFDQEKYDFSLTAKNMVKLLPFSFDIIRLARAFAGNQYSYYGEMVDKTVRNQKFKRMLTALAYVFGYPASVLPIDFIKNMFAKKYNYGYEKLITPQQGPQQLVNKMLTHFLQLGGEIQFDTRCLQIESQGDKKHIVTDKGIYTSRTVVSSDIPQSYYPAAKPGLPYHFLLLAVKKSFNYPKNVSSIAYLPVNDNAEFMEDIHAGKLPAHFGFHIAKADLPEKTDYFTLHIPFLLPQDRKINAAEKVALENFILAKSEVMLPGINDAILYKKFIFAEDFSQLHGLSSRPEPFMLSAGQEKPPAYCPETDIYYVGNAVKPEGGQAGAAILSGILAAEKILSFYRPTFHLRK